MKALHRLIPPIFGMIVLMLFGLRALAQTDQISWSVVGAGSGPSATDHGMRASLGEPVLGVSSQANTVLRTGFLVNPFFLELLTAVGPVQRPTTPVDFRLSQNFPNPFNPTTKIAITLPEESAVKLTIYNLLGQEVTRLMDERRPAGGFEVEWNSSSASGLQTGSGVYFYVL